MIKLIAVIVKQETRLVSVQQSAINFLGRPVAARIRRAQPALWKLPAIRPTKRRSRRSADRPGALVNSLGIAQEPGQGVKKAP